VRNAKPDCRMFVTPKMVEVTDRCVILAAMTLCTKPAHNRDDRKPVSNFSRAQGVSRQLTRSTKAVRIHAVRHSLGSPAKTCIDVNAANALRA
jgi:hypothetical protein